MTNSAFCLMLFGVVLLVATGDAWSAGAGIVCLVCAVALAVKAPPDDDSL